MRTPTRTLAVLALVAGLAGRVAAAQPPQTAPADPVADARKLISAGKFDEAAATIRRMLEAKPDQWDVHYYLGVTLDLQGDYATARKHLQRAIELAPEANRQQAQTAMAVSWAFESKAQEHYRKILTITSHNIQNAFARPIARRAAGRGPGA